VPRRLLWISVLAGTALSLTSTAAIATGRLIIGSAEGGWFYQYLDTVKSGTAPVFVVSCLVCIGGIAASWPLLERIDADSGRPVSRVQEWALILSWCVLALLLQGVLRSATPFKFGDLVASDTANSFYTVARRTSATSILSRFERRRQTWALHAQSNLPGKLLFVRGLTRISMRPETVAWLTLIVSNLGALLLYVFVRDLLADRFAAALSAILYLFTPAKLYFFPLLNTVTPVAVLLCVCLTIWWINSQRVIFAVLLGMAVYGLTLFEPTALVIGVLLLLVLIQRIASGRFPVRTAIAHVAAGLIAFTASYVAIRWWFGFDLIRAFAAVARDAAEFNVETGRPYALWIRQNLFDFVFGVGWCQVVLVAAALADGLYRWRSGRGFSSMPPIVLICISLAAMVGVADVIGVNRGEVTRLWIFLACLAQIPAAYVCRRIGRALAFGLVVVATLVQGVVATAMIAFVVP
jgi:hypothetical protein